MIIKVYTIFKFRIIKMYKFKFIIIKMYKKFKFIIIKIYNKFKYKIIKIYKKFKYNINKIYKFKYKINKFIYIMNKNLIYILKTSNKKIKFCFFSIRTAYYYTRFYSHPKGLMLLMCKPTSIRMVYIRLILSSLCCFNMIFFVNFPGLGTELGNNYTYLTDLDNNSVNMDPTSGNGSGNNPPGSSNNPLGSGNGGPPNPNNKSDPILDPESLNKNSKRKRPQNLISNAESLDNNSKSKRPNLNPDPLPPYESLGMKSHRKSPHYRWEFSEGRGKCIRWSFPHPKNQKLISPESFHTVQPVYNKELTVRSYVESGLRYTYDCRSKNPSEHNCTIQYPDKSKCILYDKPMVIENIRQHQINKDINDVSRKDFDLRYRKFFDTNNNENISLWLKGKR